MAANRPPDLDWRPLLALLAGLITAALGSPFSRAAEAPPYLLRYLEGLDALTDEHWSEAAKIFDEVDHAAGSDTRPVFAKGVALVMQGQLEATVAAFADAATRGHRGREPQLWCYVAERMANRVLGSGDFTNAPRGSGGVAWFSGIPGNMIQGRDDYPTDYVSFLYYEMATPFGDAAENGARTDTPQIRAKFRDGARWFANRERAVADLGVALYQRAQAQDNARDFSGALANLSIVRVSYPEDWLVAALASDCLLGLARSRTRDSAAPSRRAPT